VIQDRGIGLVIVEHVIPVGETQSMAQMKYGMICGTSGMRGHAEPWGS
jgi:hypothetical protein